MTAITQTIPNYVLGLSEQPDEQKLPGQLRKAENVILDVTEGLQKRPGSNFLTKINDIPTDANDRWFNYFRDEDEGSYIGCVKQNGLVRVWRTDTGAEMLVKDSDGNVITSTDPESTYLTHNNKPSDIQTLTVNDSTFLLNRTKTVDMTNDVSTSYLDSDSNNPDDCCGYYIELKQIAPRRSYHLNVYDDETTQTRRSITSVSIVTEDTNMVPEDETCPRAASKIYIDPASKCANRVTITGQPYVDSYDDDDLPVYFCKYTFRVDLLYGGDYPASTPLTNLYVPIMTYGTTKVYTLNIEAVEVYDCKGNIARIRPVPVDIQSEAAVTATAVLGSIFKPLDNINGLTAEIIGNGIYVNRSTGFNVEAVENDLFNIVGRTVNDVTRLPRQCKHGFIVKVINSDDTSDDDYYLKFIGENNKSGPGRWEECAEPGIKTTFDNTTMPHLLTRTNSTTMTLAPITWDIREVGDEITNEKPSFVDKKIEQVLYHRDRIVFLSGPNIILTQPGNIYNFWNNTALTFSGTDRIDISCSSSTPNLLQDGIELNTGLVVFSANAQYLFATDSDLLNPNTAKIFTLSTYNYNTSMSPISLGTSLAFVDNAGKRSRVFQMLNIRREEQPIVTEKSKNVSSLLSKDLDIITNSRENSVILLGKRGTNTIYGFKYYAVGEKELQGAWFTWKFERNIIHNFIVNDKLFLCFTDGNFSTMDLRQTDSTNAAALDSEDYITHLDNATVVPEGTVTYNNTTNKSSFTLPLQFNESVNLGIVKKDNEGWYQQYTHDGSTSPTVTVNGDWTGSNDLIVGEQYTMSIQLPTIYPQSSANNRVVSDTRGSVVIHRMKFNFGQTGQYKTILDRKGKDSYVDTHESILFNTSDYNELPYQSDTSVTIPVYEKNTNVDVSITSEHPSPATIYSMSWEGDYNNRFYKRI